MRILLLSSRNVFKPDCENSICAMKLGLFNESYTMFEEYSVEANIDIMAQNAAQVAYHSFKWQYTSLILFNVSCMYGLHVFMKIYDKNIKLYNITDSVPDIKSVEDVNQFVVFLTEVTNIQKLLNAIGIEKLNTNAKFIIICEDAYQCDQAQAVKILWTYRIVNVIFIKNEDSLISGYTYFQGERCDHPTPRRLTHWDKCIESSKKVIKPCKKHMFPPKFRNFNRCPLIVSTFVQSPYMYIKDGEPSGADGDLLRCIVHTLNATLVLVSPSDDDGSGSYENHTWTGSLGDVYNNVANVSMTSATITFNRFKYFDMSMNYNTMDLVWVTHPSEFESSSLKLLKPFTTKARVLFIVTFMFVIVLHILLKMTFMEKFKARFNTGIHTDSFLVYAFQISLGFSVAKYPRNLYKHAFLFWIWYWFFVRTLYQVYLIHSLQTDVPLNNINTLEDAIDEGYQFGSGPAVKDYFVDEHYIYNNWIHVDSNDISSIMIDIAKGKKFLLAINLVRAKMFQKRTRLSLHILPHNILRSHTVLFFKKNSCLTRDVNYVLTRLFEAGIPDKLFEMYTYSPKRTNNPQEILTFKHFKACFALLIFGYILSFFIFMVEKLFGTNCKIMRKLYR